MTTSTTSWFGIHISVLKLFNSYLLPCFFRVKCDNDFSSEYISSGVLSRLCCRSSVFRHVYHATPHSHLTFSTPPPIRMQHFSHSVLVALTHISCQASSTGIGGQLLQNSCVKQHFHCNCCCFVTFLPSDAL